MRNYTEPKISLLAYVEEDILTESLTSVPAKKSETTEEQRSTVTLNMKDIIRLGE